MTGVRRGLGKSEEIPFWIFRFLREVLGVLTSLFIKIEYLGDGY